MMSWNQSPLRKHGRCLFCLLFALLLAAGGIGAARGDASVPVLNSSGNQNIRVSVDPIRKVDNFSAVLYDSRSGLPTSEANAVAQTAEGFLWIGSYAGLIRYDGAHFEQINSPVKIENVRCLYVDSLDRLWIGTNDSGVLMMERNTVSQWDEDDGLKSLSIRALTEDSRGTIYAASAVGMAMIDADQRLTFLEDERISGQIVQELRQGREGLIYGLTQRGDIFAVLDGRITAFLSQAENRIQGVTAILPDPELPDRMYVGTESNLIYYGSFDSGFSSMGVRNIAPLNYVERMESIGGEIWICAENGIGKMDSEGFHRLKNVPLKNAVQHVLTDFDGNLWFTSSKQGIMKIVPNRFTNLSERYELPETVVNSTCMLGSQLFIGTDTGLIVLESGNEVESFPLDGAATASGTPLDVPDLLKYLDGVRIRCIVRDSAGRLWISTWRKHGLICYDQNRITVFTPEDGLFSNMIRSVLELEDGSLLVANTGGVSVIQDGRIVSGYSEKDGLTVTEILTMAEGPDHTLVFGTDGGGIYVVTDEGIRHIGKKEGLTSEVIRRVRRSVTRNLFWVLTSNSLSYLTPDGRVTEVQHFPWSNNYDVYENSLGDLWILSSNGIYIISAEDLLADEPANPVFFSVRQEFDLFASTDPAKEVGGDFYDFFLINEDHLALVIADVSGKGIPAALFMMISKAILKNQLVAGSDPASAMEWVNLHLFEHNSSMMFVTVWVAVLELSTGKGVACNAGHENPGLRRAGGDFELLRYPHNMVVGIDPMAKYKNRDFELHPGDCVFVYTDGVPEANDAARKMFGEDRLREALNQNPDAGPQELIQTVYEAVNNFTESAPQFDDITMLCLKYFGPHP